MPHAYYNEFNAYAAEWLRNLIDAELIASGDVDSRNIRDVQPGDVRGYSQCHFFAGIGGWSLAARLAGWPDSRPLWSGSCPCQPFSVAGAGAGEADERHLWPEFHRLIAAARPPVVVGEQVASPLGRAWFAGVRDDMEASGYAARGIVIPACGIGAPHRRERLWFAAEALGNADGDGCETWGCAEPAARFWNTVNARGREHSGDMGNPAREQRAQRQSEPRDFQQEQPPAAGTSGSFWGGADWLECSDGKRRRIKPGIPLLVDGLPREVVGMLAGFGNAIVPQVAAEVLAAFMDCRP